MNNVQEMMAAFVQVMGQALAQNQEPQATPPVVTPELQAAETKKVARLRQYARKVAEEIDGVFANFDAEVVAQIASGLQFKAMDQYFWSEDMMEKALLARARQEAAGARHDDISEVNELRELDNRIAFHERNVEQYETLNYIAEALWLAAERAVILAGGELRFVPDFSLSEKQRAAWHKRRNARQQSQQSVNRATIQGARMSRAAHNGFLDQVGDAEASA